MAKVTAPLLSFGASGAIAKTQVYATWKGRPYVRRHVIPSNPKTVAQTLTRDVFSNASSIWKLMSADGISPWDRFADGQVLTGRNAFMASFVRELRGEVDLVKMIGSPGAKGGLPPLTAIPTGISTGIDVIVTTPTPPTGWTLTSAVGMVILDADPSLMTVFVTQTDEDLAAALLQFTGLTPSVPYQVMTWLRWAKPDTSIAYGPSLLSQATPLV